MVEELGFIRLVYNYNNFAHWIKVIHYQIQESKSVIQLISKKNEIVEGRIELGTQNGGKFRR